MKTSSATRLLLSLAVTAIILPTSMAQNNNNNGGGTSNNGNNVVDPSFTEDWDSSLDYAGCFSDLAASDKDGDGFIKDYEYLGFIQEYGKRICHQTDQLSLNQAAAFNALACRCRSQEGASFNCCLGQNAQIDTSGSLDPSRTSEQAAYLTAVCRVTDGTIPEPRGCKPDLYNPNDPPPLMFAGAGAVVPAAPETGLSAGEKAGIIVGAILGLLLLCCLGFCCLWKRRRAVDEEEVEEVKEVTEDVEQAPSEVPPSQDRDIMAEPAMMAPAAIMAVPPRRYEDEEEVRGKKGAGHIDQYEEDEDMRRKGGSGQLDEYEDVEDVRGGRGSGNIQDEEEDEEVRKRRGYGKIDETDPDPNRRLRGAGAIPDPNNPQEKVVLRPIEKEHEEDPDWDYAGRDMNYPKDKDVDEAQILDPYVPDGGVYIPEREKKPPLDWKNKWERPEVEDPDDYDNRKHRIQAGLGAGEVFDHLDEEESAVKSNTGEGGDVFDWVVQSALGVLDKTDMTGNLDDQTKEG
ncbi:hypothetical protein MPSEU_000261900 [Mayamaea pseudoterrestris]|nr:hypothetical protein MPSEU_000261900 [Mayamaea pseudoterrestris]